MDDSRSLFCLLACLLPALGGCRGALAFDIARDIPEQTVAGDPVAHAAGTLVPDRAVINPFQLNIDLAAEAAAMGTPVARVHLSALTLTITSTAQPAGDQDCWDFVENITIRAESTQAGSSLAPVTIATGTRPGCVQTFALTPASNVDLKPYIEQGIRITTSASGVPPADDVSFNGRVVLRAEPF